MRPPKQPGVWIEETSSLPPAIVAVATAIPAFVGYTAKAKENEDDTTQTLIRVPKRISSLLEYEQHFGLPKMETGFSVAITEFDGKKSIEVTAPDSATESPFLMYYGMQMYFANGGGACYVLSVNTYADALAKNSVNPVQFNDLSNGLTLLQGLDEATILVFPDATSLADPTDFYNLYNAALQQCDRLGGRFTIIDTYTDDAEVEMTAAVGVRNSIAEYTSQLKYGAVYFPYLDSILDYHYDENKVPIAHNVHQPALLIGSNRPFQNTTKQKRRTSIAANKSIFYKNAPKAMLPRSAGALDGLTLTEVKNYDITIYAAIKTAIQNLSLQIPPSTTMAGIYARMDRERGVWKVPANLSLTYVIKPSKNSTPQIQSRLKVDAVSGKSINEIIAFPGKGVLVWGARTLAGNSNEWRYISVSRFFTMVEKSVKKAMAKFIFEQNNANTWAKAKAMIANFLTLQWKAGALAGSKQESAFYTRIGLGETMTARDILEGNMIIEIGMAVMRPAEFIVLKFNQKVKQS